MRVLKWQAKVLFAEVNSGGADRDRTDDLLNAMRETRVDLKGKFKHIKGLSATDYH
jgi:hypothetical protein